MKVCPVCQKDFNRLAKGHVCPKCKTPLFDSAGTIRRQSDKILVDTILKMVNTHISNRDKVVYEIHRAEDSRDRKTVYMLLDRSRVMLAAQTDLKVSPEEFTSRLVLSIIKDPWWGLNLDAICRVGNKTFIEKANTLVKEIRKAQTAKEIEIQKLTDYLPSGLNTHYAAV